MFHVEQLLGMITMERRLGRGLGSLLKPDEPSAAEGAEIDLDRITPNPRQPRELFEPEALGELEESIRLHGILQPILVRPLGAGYQIVSGERRWRAAKAAGLRTIPAVVRPEVGDHEILELALVENLQRKDLNPVERARGFLNLIQELGLTQDQVAQRIGLPRSTITNHLRLLELAPPVQQALEKGLISMGHAKAMLGIRSTLGQEELLGEVVRKGLSVREVERQARTWTDKGSLVPHPKPTNETSVPAWATHLEARMRASLGTKVAIHNRGEGYQGEIVISYFDRKSLDRLVEVLAEAPRPV
jgi:ParB family chromosome partitioning protein